MITLRDLAALHDEFSSDLDLPVTPVEVAGLVIGDDAPTLMGVVNLSRDSSYRESVAVSAQAAVRMGRVQALQGAGVIDLGAESSHSGKARVGVDAQIRALVPVVEQLSEHAVVSVETYHPEVVKAALAAGARVLNMTGREHEEQMLQLAAEFEAAVVLCYGEVANVREISDLDLVADPLPRMVDHFGSRLERARDLGAQRLMIDPGLGFYYGNMVEPTVRARHQTKVLAQCFRLRSLGVPVCNALPTAFDLFGEELRTAEGFFAVVTALGGTHVLRTHEVPRVHAVLGAMSALSVR